MITYKVKSGKYILNLYMPERMSGKVVLLLPGVPISSNIDKLLLAFLDAGCVVFYPYLSGSFDSGGDFNGFTHIKEVNELIKIAQKEKITEIYYKKVINIGLNNKIILAGMSYGSLIALLGKTKNIDKLLLMSPVFFLNQKDISNVLDFDFKNQMTSLLHLLKTAFPFSYRPSNFISLKSFLFGESVALKRESIEKSINNIDSPTLIIHGTKDTSVPYKISESLKNSCTNNKIKWLFPEARHSNSSYGNEVFRIIKKFLA